jgi:hypothetical protein
LHVDFRQWHQLGTRSLGAVRAAPATLRSRATAFAAGSATLARPLPRTLGTITRRPAPFAALVALVAGWTRTTRAVAAIAAVSTAAALLLALGFTLEARIVGLVRGLLRPGGKKLQFQVQFGLR